jgi:hypothetical protein
MSNHALNFRHIGRETQDRLAARADIDGNLWPEYAFTDLLFYNAKDDSVTFRAFGHGFALQLT